MTLHAVHHHQAGHRLGGLEQRGVTVGAFFELQGRAATDIVLRQSTMSTPLHRFDARTESAELGLRLVCRLLQVDARRLQ